METLKAWDGTLSSNDFYNAAKALCEKWKQIECTLPQWTWISSKREEGYLSLENVFYTSLNEDPVDEGGISEEEVSDDCATLVRCTQEETHIYNFHIVYSFSFRVPVLYFRCYRCDGQPLSLHDIGKDFPSHSQSLLEVSKWTFMTQQEHPFLHCPWYTLHPCGTDEWMKLLINDKRHKDLVIACYLPSWLSVVGQAVGLRIPLNLLTEASPKPILLNGND